MAPARRCRDSDNPDTARSLNDLASLHRDQGDSAAARLLFERALGPDHPDTVATGALAEPAAEGNGPAAAG